MNRRHTGEKSYLRGHVHVRPAPPAVSGLRLGREERIGIAVGVTLLVAMAL
jgi:hypothetical protein